MKILYVVRHAKAVKSSDEIADIDRALKNRGTVDAHQMGNSLSSHNAIPETLISSPAIRAMSTAFIFADELKFPKTKIVIDPLLYETSYQNYLDAIRKIGNEKNVAMLVGHNPVISEVCSFLANKKVELSTCAIAVFEINADRWSDTDQNNSALKHLLKPMAEEEHI
jgi:phosphohistidine phosphatase